MLLQVGRFAHLPMQCILIAAHTLHRRLDVLRQNQKRRGKSRNPLILIDGADNRSRTYDLRITNALLYQLSYIGPERPVTSVTTGQKVRSIRVMRQCPFESNGYFCITRDYLRPNRIVTEADPLVRGQRFQPHRTARVQFLRADRHLSAEAELAAVGEAGGGIHIYR